MKYKQLGKSGLKVSTLCLGTMQFGWSADEETSINILNAAYDAGINFIDTADIYSRWVEGNPGGVAESIIGKWLRNSGIPRHEVVIATKVRGRMGNGPNDEGLSRAHIMNAVDQSLTRLGTDYIDLYQAHWFDEHTPIDETLKAFDDLVRIGKVRYIGVSNFPAWRLMQALWISDKLGTAPVVSLQPHYNLLHREEFERELMAVCETYRIGVIPYSPLAGGFLTGKYKPKDENTQSVRKEGVKTRYFTPKGWSTLSLLQEIADKYTASPSQVALAWLHANPVITAPIIGPRTLDQLQDNLKSITIQLEPEDVNALSEQTSWEK